MEKEREELLEKLFKEMIYTFRSLKPEGHSWGGEQHDRWGKHKFGRGHIDLFFRLVKEKEGISVKDIAEAMNITPGAVTQMVDKTVEMGIVTREEDPNDRRSQRIKLSREAKDKVNWFRKNFFEKLEPKVANLNNEEILQLATLLEKINQPSLGEKV